MKANQAQYEEAIKHYDSAGPSAVYAYALDIGIDEQSYCIGCEEDTPDCDDNCCLVCGQHKPSQCGGYVSQLRKVARCALADLEGIMPEFEPSGDRTHPAWKTILELRHILK